MEEAGDAFAVGRDRSPGGLFGREAELQELVEFCAGPEPYVYWQAPPWAGKTTLMASFALHAPAGVTVIAYFVTRRQAGENDSTGFLRSVSVQLAALTGEDVPGLLSSREIYRSFLTERARQADAAGQCLVLLIDGLDEDTGTYPGSGLDSIASLLPKVPMPGMKVIVSGRTDPKLPEDVPAGHPLRSCRVRRLANSPYATEVERTARLELRDLLATGGLRRDLVGLITASGGGLTMADLEELTNRPRHEIETLLGAAFGRTVVARTDPMNPDAQHVCVFSHDTLREQAVDILGPRQLARYRDPIHAWADMYRTQEDGWPADLRDT